jgi:hypothetical protein
VHQHCADQKGMAQFCAVTAWAAFG